MRQTRALCARLARELGEPIDVAGQIVHAFPVPERLVDVASFAGLPEETLGRLRGVARAAADGGLDCALLRAMPTADALADLQQLRGRRPVRVAGHPPPRSRLVDEVTDDDVTLEAVQVAYGLPRRPAHHEVMAVAEAWRPFRMWATVLLHVSLRREHGGPTRSGAHGRDA